MLRFQLPSFEEYPLNTDAAGSAPPDAFGPFRVLHQIGAGVLGPVFRAYQPEQDRLVAVKLFRLDLPPERTHRLVAELEKIIAADLAHPGIAAPLAAGISEVSAYLAMDFVAADSLDIVVRDGGPSAPADVVRVAAQLGSALDVAAAIGIFHGALHPRDVLLSADDVRMTGIGVTHALDQVGFAAPIRRPYTAPERAAGGAWDRRADVFSLAALMYELLTGRRIAGFGNQAAESIGDVAGAHADLLRRAFSRALAEDPSDRFATAGDFAKAVHASFGRKRTVVPRAPSNGRTTTSEPTVAVRGSASLPADELPLLTDAMLSTERDTSRAAEAAPPPLGGLPHDSIDLPLSSEPSRLAASDDRRTANADGLSTDDHRLSTDDYRLSTDEPSPPSFDITEVFTSDADEVPSRPPSFESADAGGRSPSNVWPLMLALVVGIALGFGMAMLLLSRDRVPAAPQEAATTPARPAPVEVREEPIRESTEPAVAPKPPAPEPAKPPVAAFTEKSVAAIPTPPPAKPPVAKPGATKPAVAVRSPERQGRAAAKPPAVKPPVAKAQVARPPATKPSIPTAQTRSATRPATAPKPTLATPVKTGPGSLAVDSRPAGASVFLDGKLIGTTPLVMETMAAGEHAIHLDRDGYRRWATSVRVVSGDRSRVAASLER